MADATTCHVCLKTGNHVINDSISELHYRGTYLHIAASELNEFKCIPPGFDTTDTGCKDKRSTGTVAPPPTNIIK